MKYKKYSNHAYNIHVIETDKFKRNMIKINFKKKIVKKDLTLRNLITKVLLNSNGNYKTRRELEIKTEDLYNLSCGGSTSISGNYILTSFKSVFLNEKYTEKNMNLESIKFFFNLIFNPLVNNNKFTTFDLAYRELNDEINTYKDNKGRYAKLKMFENLDPTRPHKAVGYIEDLENITNEELYDEYKKMLKSDEIDIFIIGNFDSDIIKGHIENLININTVKKSSGLHFIDYKKEKKLPKIIKEKDTIEQTKLSIGIKLFNLTDFELKYVLNLYTYILGGGPDSKLFKNVREKNSLCYSINATYNPIDKLIIISAGINKEDCKKTISLIKQQLQDMSKGDFSEQELEAGILTYVNALKDIEDYPSSILRMYESKEYLNFDLIETRIEEIKKVNIKDIIKVSKKIKLDTIFVLEGATNEKR